MDSVKELVNRECGGANPLLKLTSHVTKDNALKEIGRVPHATHDQFLDEFFTDDHKFEMAPNTFSMNALLQEVEQLSRHPNVKRPSTAEAGFSIGVTSDHWLDEFSAINSVPGVPLSVADNVESEWTAEFLHYAASPRHNGTSVLDSGGLLAWEYLEQIETQQQESSINENSLKWMEQFTETDALADSARDILCAVDDPKLTNSQFMKFMKQISDGHVTVKNNEVIVKNDVILSEQCNDNWTAEFLSDTVADQQWASDFLGSSAAEVPWVNEFIDRQFENPSDALQDASYSDTQTDMLAQKWVEEFTNSSTTLDDERPQEDFWELLQQQWDDRARVFAAFRNDPEGSSSWLADYDVFSADSYIKDYVFQEDNAMIDHPHPLDAGIERLRAGDIPGAVLLFEAAVQKDPQNAEAWQYLGTTLADNEQEPEAIAALRRCLNINPANLTALMSLAVSFTNESLFQRACETLRDWLQRHPRYCHLVNDASDKHSAARRPQITSFLSSDFHESVLESFLKAVQPGSEPDADVQIGLGILFHLTSNYDKAIDCFRAALQIRPNDSLLWNKLGATLANASRSEEAVEAYRQALVLSPGYIRTRYNLGIACVNLGVYREAIDHFLSALQLQHGASGRPVATSSSSSSHHRSLMSENLWSAVANAVKMLGRDELTPACNQRDIEALTKAFPDSNRTGSFSESAESDTHVNNAPDQQQQQRSVSD